MEDFVKRLGFLIFVLVILAGGGLLTTILANGGTENLLPFLQQTANPEASTMTAVPWQTEQLFLLVGFILFNMIGIAVTLAVIMWFLNRQVTIVRAQEAAETEAETAG